MIVLNPQRVQFGTALLEGVTWVALDREGTRLVREWSDEGPHLRFIDVPEQLVTVQVVQELVLEDLATPFVGAGFANGPGVGTQATLTFVTCLNATDRSRRRITLTGVLVSMAHSVSRRRATRTLVFQAITTDGAADPVVLSDAGTT